MHDPLHIEIFCLGQWMTNCYVVHGQQSCWIVDVGFEPEPMFRFIEQKNLSVERIVLTHAHVDHIAGLADAAGRFPDAPIAIHESEHNFAANPELNLSAFLAEPVSAPTPTETLVHGDMLELSGHQFAIRHTPGHSPGGITLYQPQMAVALVGDTLFDGSIGRHDFPTSSFTQLQQSIREQLYSLPDQTRVLPGHMGPTTIGKEKATNPFVRD